MTREQERRDPNAERVKVSTLVEVCGNIPGIPVFEAESVNVSQRGMQLRTAYLPEDGAPLVCRFESEGREIVVEGEVAWRHESSRGGEFGVKFTALDGRSVDVLRGMCGMDAAGDTKAGPTIGEAGARVRLHIEGLGSPMKARVKTGGSAKLSVGSSLEFLKVGKRLEIEDLDVGGRRAAQIDGVSVVVDPSTRVPQLVVGLRFEGADETTPSPSTSSVDDKEAAAAGVRIPAHHISSDADPAPSERARATASEDDDGGEGDEPEMRGRVAAAAVNAREKAKAAGESLARASAQAAKGASSWLKIAAGKVVELSQRKTPQRRTTSPAPGGALSSEKPKLRSQSGSKTQAAAEPAKPRSRKLIAGAAGAVVISAAALAFAMRSPSAPPGDKLTADAKTAEVGAAEAKAAAPGVPATAAAPGLPNEAGLRNGPVTANVPLFGPTPLTTTEPAPLGPPPGSESADVEASERAQAKAGIAPKNLDEAFPGGAEEGPGPASRERGDDESKASTKSGAKPEDVTPWGHGKLQEPTIHRLRLDGPGAKLTGTMDPTGFTVVIPNRKVMENGASISKRDARIARIRAVNTPVGAQVSFRFRDGVPSYRVRLRRDNVEILLSEPSPSAKAAEASDTKKSKKSR